MLDSVLGIDFSKKSLHLALRNITRLLRDDISESRPILKEAAGDRIPGGRR
jgi:hypothetical protein